MVAHTEQAKLDTAIAITQSATLLLVARIKGARIVPDDLELAIVDAYIIFGAALNSIKVET